MEYAPIVFISLIVLVTASPIMHEGNCPPDAHYNEIVETHCENDGMCETNQRCCPVDQTMQCVEAVDFIADISQLKYGECPYLEEEDLTNARDCKVNQDCPARDICCHGKCVTPLPPKPVPHEGFCPVAVRMPVVNASCQHDTDCPKSEKCCHKGEEIKCVQPVFFANDIRKPGHCPPVEEDEKLNASKLCNVDDDCFNADKCCPTSLTFRCVTGQAKPAPPKPGCCANYHSLPTKLMPRCLTDYDCIGVKKCCLAFGIMDCVYPSKTSIVLLKPIEEFDEMFLHSMTELLSRNENPYPVDLLFRRY
uniref:WAP domain-containing protein n=1 Tax=Trichuris muris TaxID=70415 RepID=A0A5S6QGL3_TRIMR